MPRKSPALIAVMTAVLVLCSLQGTLVEGARTASVPTSSTGEVPGVFPRDAGPSWERSGSPPIGSQGPYATVVNPFQWYPSEPAPMGVVDYGLGANSTGYQYTTPSLVGSADIGSFRVSNQTGDTGATFQLNGNVPLYTVSGTYWYWTQMIAILNTTTDTVVFLDNIWNSSHLGAVVVSSTLNGSGWIYPSSGGYYYYEPSFSSALPGDGINLRFPTVVELRMNYSVSSGLPKVAFSYSDGFGWVLFDTVTFHFSHTLSASGFDVDGFHYLPTGGLTDAEMIVGGDLDYRNTTDRASNLSLQLEFWNGHNYQQVTNAYNFGDDTGETILNVTTSVSMDPLRGSVDTRMGTGPGTLGVLYNQSVLATPHFNSALSQGTYLINGTARGQFVGSPITLGLPPGSYTIALDSSGYQYGALSFSVAAGTSPTFTIPTLPQSMVQFHMSGLPAKTVWSVDIASRTGSTTNASLTFPVPFGNYSYQVAPHSGFVLKSYQGTVNANAAQVQVWLNWTPYVVPVYFNETGLPNGDSWTVFSTVPGGFSNVTGANTSLTAWAPNGSLQFGVSTDSPFNASPPIGSLPVSGRPCEVAIVFVPINATVRGTIYPTDAVVQLNSSRVAVNNSTGAYFVRVPPGLYVIVTTAKGFHNNTTAIWLGPGQLLALNITLVANGSSTPEQSSPSLTLLLGASVAVAAAVAAGVALFRKRRREAS